MAILGEEGDDISGAEAMAAKYASQPPTPQAKEETKPEPPNPPSQRRESESKPELPSGDRIFASPIAKKIALERGIPLAKVKGTGPNGRIVRDDVENYKPTGVTATAGPTTTSPGASTPSPDYTDIPVSNMRRTIGLRLTQSKQDVPHYYVTADINLDKLLKLREVFNETLTEKDKVAKLSVNDFIVKAASCALSDVPEANSAWLGEVIRQ
jgi:pyruvate dehydrogenase E2 component (dihydrolipoamide acetyltransferase)